MDVGPKLWKEWQDATANSAGEDQIKIALSGEIMSNWHCWGWYPDKPATLLGNNLDWLPDLLGRFVKHCWGCRGSALLENKNLIPDLRDNTLAGDLNNLWWDKTAGDVKDPHCWELAESRARGYKNLILQMIDQYKILLGRKKPCPKMPAATNSVGEQRIPESSKVILVRKWEIGARNLKNNSTEDDENSSDWEIH